MGDKMRKAPITWDGTGTVTATANLLTQYHLVLLKHLQQTAHKRFNIKIGSTDAVSKSDDEIERPKPKNVRQVNC